jgi:hypothetical protein
MRIKFSGALEGPTRVQLDLTSSADSIEYSARAAGEVTSRVFEDGISIASQRERTLRVAWDREIWAIQKIVGFRSKRNLRTLWTLEALLYREINLGKPWAAQYVASSSAKLPRRWQSKGTWIKPA